MSNPLKGTAYLATARLGRGGMGEVWAAEHIQLGKRVVVKVLHANLASRRSYLERFRVEARVLAKLCHPNLVSVSDFGYVEGRPYFVMERIEGDTLAAELQERRVLPLAEVRSIARQLLAGLGTAHAAGVIHRDIKPANIIYGAPGSGVAGAAGARRVVLIDFGLVKDTSAGRDAMAPTQQGQTMGTPSYFAPEQALGQPVDKRTDLYAVGVLLYRMLAGKTPFDHHKFLPDLVRAHCRETPRPVSQHTRGLPAQLDAVILRALAKHPADRFASAEALLQALEAACEAPAPVLVAAPAPLAPLVERGAPRPAPVARRSALRPAPWAVLGAVAVSLLIVACAFALEASGR